MVRFMLVGAKVSCMTAALVLTDFMEVETECGQNIIVDSNIGRLWSHVALPCLNSISMVNDYTPVALPWLTSISMANGYTPVVLPCLGPVSMVND